MRHILRAMRDGEPYTMEQLAEVVGRKEDVSRNKLHLVQAGLMEHIGHGVSRLTHAGMRLADNPPDDLGRGYLARNYSAYARARIRSAGKRDGNMPWHLAAAHVLQLCGQPMTIEEITDEIMTQGLRQNAPDGICSPSRCVGSKLAQHVGTENYPVRRLRRGVYAYDPSCSSSDLHVTTIDDHSSRLDIKAYGILWDRRGVYWTRSPRLYGKQDKDDGKPIDMSEQRGIYVLHDNSTPIYVGRAIDSSIISRLKKHTQNRLKDKWNRFSWFGFRRLKACGSQMAPLEVGVRGRIIEIEAMLIALLASPSNNKQGDLLPDKECAQNLDPRIKQDIIEKIQEEFSAHLEEKLNDQMARLIVM